MLAAARSHRNGNRHAYLAVTAPQEPIQRRALKNTFMGGVSFLLTAVVGFVSVPICLRSWGNDRYGAWLALIAGFMMLRTLDNGYLNYVGNQLNVLYHEDRQRMRRSLASSLWVCIGLGLLQFLVWAVLLAAGKLSALFGVASGDVERHGLGAALGILVVAWMLGGSFFGIVHRLQIPAGMMFQAAWWGIGYQAVQVVALISAALLHATVTQAAMLYAFLQVAVYVASCIYIAWKLPEFFPWWRGPDAKTGIQDFVRSLLLTWNGIGQQATVSGVVLFVSSSFGTAAVPLFTTVRTLANMWVSLAGIFSAPLLPEIVRFHGTREHGKLFRAFEAHWFFSAFLVNASMIAVIPFIEPFYVTWTHRALHFDRGLFLYAVASVSLINFASGLNTYLAGINSLAAQLVTTSTRAAVMFAAAFLLVPSQGLRGLGAGMLAAEVVCSVGLPVYFANQELAKFGGRLPTRTVAFALLGTLPVQSLTVAGIMIGRVGAGHCAVAAISECVIAWLGWRRLDHDVKSRVLQLLRR
jgi:O-antigen/teichoic acid export membrane protein